ncbi:MAG: DUF3147 family protein [Acidimicrobiales bacterium]
MSGGLVPLLLKALNGGLIVTLFAVVGQVAQPKRFAGIFSAAPTIALANLTVVVLTVGTTDLRTYAIGMTVGAAGFLAYALGCQRLLDRFGSLPGSAASFVLWFAVALPGYWLVTR